MNFKNLYAITDRESIMDPQDCGLVNGQLSINGWLTEVNEIRQLFAPPIFSENFPMCVRVNISLYAQTCKTFKTYNKKNF